MGSATSGAPAPTEEAYLALIGEVPFDPNNKKMSVEGQTLYAAARLLEPGNPYVGADGWLVEGVIPTLVKMTGLPRARCGTIADRLRAAKLVAGNGKEGLARRTRAAADDTVRALMARVEQDKASAPVPPAPTEGKTPAKKATGRKAASKKAGRRRAPTAKAPAKRQPKKATPPPVDTAVPDMPLPVLPPQAEVAKPEPQVNPAVLTPAPADVQHPDTVTIKVTRSTPEAGKSTSEAVLLADLVMLRTDGVPERMADVLVEIARRMEAHNQK